MRPKKIKLEPGEYIIAVVPEKAAGPGWANSPTWVYIAGNGKLRKECIQPNERTDALHALFNIGLAVCEALSEAVPTELRK